MKNRLTKVKTKSAVYKSAKILGEVMGIFRGNVCRVTKKTWDLYIKTYDDARENGYRWN
ncbi:hypothetical protein OAJ00_02440 [Paracoccaceae bacterium]|nr:hypothetical protein [Paracoccaceae bacterium]